MGEGGTWKEKLRQQMSRNPEPVPGMPLVEIGGYRRVLIENHQGVLVYSLEEIRVKVSYGCICITGCDLRLMQLSKEQLVICGRVDSIHLFGR